MAVYKDENNNRFIIRRSYGLKSGDWWEVTCLWCGKFHEVDTEHLRKLQCCEAQHDNYDLKYKRVMEERALASSQKKLVLADLLETPVHLWLADGLIYATRAPNKIPANSTHRITISYVNVPHTWRKTNEEERKMAGNANLAGYKHANHNLIAQANKDRSPHADLIRRYRESADDNN